jgi:uncharacterized membrane protein
MLLPFVLTFLLISKAMGIIRDAATKIISVVTHQAPDAGHSPIVLAVLPVLAVFFRVGLILTSRVGSQSSQWMEQTIFFQLPADAAVKNIIYGLADGKVSLNLRLLSSYD